jgi:hypothetical protein
MAKLNIFHHAFTATMLEILEHHFGANASEFLKAVTCWDISTIKPEPPIGVRRREEPLPVTMLFMW